MKPVELKFHVTLDEPSVRVIVDLVSAAVRQNFETDSLQVARLTASHNALFGSEKPPEDRGLLIDTANAAKLLKVSRRTIWKMEHFGEMPKAIRIGKAVRWSYEELQQWIAAGCPARPIE